MNVLASIEFVGITDLFAESCCLLYYRLLGELPLRCVCAPDEAAGALAHEVAPHRGNWTAHEPIRGATKHIDHGMPHGIHPDTLPPQSLARIDAITAVDQQLYRAALRRFLQEARKVERDVGLNFICAKRINELSSDLSYLRDDDILWPHE